MSVYERLLSYQDETYKEFQSKLVPNIDKETIIGVRTPQIRSIVKEIFGTEEANIFLKTLPHQYYEENLVHIFLVSKIKDYNECVKEIERFLPYIDCWPVCDQATPLVFKKNHDKLLPYIKKWIKSNKVYTARFGIRMLMNEFLNDDFKEEYLEWISSINGDDYYLKMMVAWFFATALAKQYDATIKYIENKCLDPWVHHKTIQKAIESYRISDEHKEYLKKFR
jgi:3-methyladenine DNA glycosylase AlkD